MLEFVCLPWSEVCSARVTSLLLLLLLLLVHNWTFVWPSFCWPSCGPTCEPHPEPLGVAVRVSRPPMKASLTEIGVSGAQSLGTATDNSNLLVPADVHQGPHPAPCTRVPAPPRAPGSPSRPVHQGPRPALCTRVPVPPRAPGSPPRPAWTHGPGHAAWE